MADTSSDALTLPIPAEWLEAITARVRDELRDELGAAAPVAGGYLDRAEAARYLGHKSTDWLARDRSIPRYQPGGPGGKTYYRVTDLDAYMALHRVGGQS